MTDEEERGSIGGPSRTAESRARHQSGRHYDEPISAISIRLVGPTGTISPFVRAVEAERSATKQRAS